MNCLRGIPNISSSIGSAGRGRYRPAGRAGIGLDADLPALHGRRSGPVADPAAPRLPPAPHRRGVRQVRRHVDRVETEGRHHPGALRPLDPGQGDGAPAAALVHPSRRSALGGLTGTTPWRQPESESADSAAAAGLTRAEVIGDFYWKYYTLVNVLWLLAGRVGVQYGAFTQARPAEALAVR